MNRIRIIRRLACLVAGLTCAVLSSAIAIPAALAEPLPPFGGARGGIPAPPVPPHPIATGGMLGWQVTLIAIGAAVLAAALTALLGRVRVGRRQLAHSGA